MVATQLLKFKDVASLESFKTKFQRLANDCFANVIDCLSFELSVDTSDALSVLIYERHSRQGHFKDRHDILKALDLDKEKAGVIESSTRTFVESDLGHMERW
ncbi:hypothetical protein TL16_g03294 [Triparma laevis f. inornata]|uniref:Uncharacterized protein n=1 Tax=Triparma laevis f. inornata TaxID=1714386 RepID=A0A9W7A462_9STRA|nr:hypothetical protein TL16_g03294 [Triparma laevis f. inornata]